MTALSALAWPAARLAEGIEALARGAGLDARAADLPPPPADGVDRWLDTAGAWLGVELEPVSAPYPELEALLRRAGPALLRRPEGDFLLLAAGSARGATLLAPDLRRVRVPLDVVREALAAPLEATVAPAVDALLADAGIPPARRARARRALFDERLRFAPVAATWVVRPAPDAPFVVHLRANGVFRALAAMVAAHAGAYALALVAWALVGRGALQGHLDAGWLVAWALVLAGSVPLRVAAVWAQGRVALGWGAALKQRLLVGALRVDPEAVRHQGAGAMLGQVVESEAVESLALNGGFGAVVALLDLAFAAAILSGGAAGAALAPLLVAWAVLTLALAWRYHGARARWTGTRLDLTADLVERMSGHRTRLAQERPDRWHSGEDAALARYLEESAALDRAAVRLQTWSARGWIVAATLAFALAFVPGAAGTAALAVALGGVLLGGRALTGLAQGAAALAGAAIAARRVLPLFRAAADAGRLGVPALVGATPAKGPLLVASDVVFRYADRPRPVLDGVDVEIAAGDRVLLEGPSGGGKSTLAALLVGLRAPSSGLLLLRGLDQGSLGDAAWRRAAVAAPQFHENRVLLGTFAFNLLMGRRWPPTPQDVDEAEAVCRELGLGPLIDRMPAGMMQMVGESGWQLSHGERSRLFLARALLQDADLVVLDESFGALDPENLERALRCARERARTLVVVAHP